MQRSWVMVAPGKSIVVHPFRLKKYPCVFLDESLKWPTISPADA